MTGTGHQIHCEDAARMERGHHGIDPLAIAGDGSIYIIRTGEVQIIDHDIIFPVLVPQPLIGIGDMDLRPVVGKAHFLPGDIDQLPIEIDAG